MKEKRESRKWIEDPRLIERARVVLVLHLSRQSSGELVRIIMDWLDDSIAKAQATEETEEPEPEPESDNLIDVDDEDIRLMAEQALKIEQQQEAIRGLLHNIAELNAKFVVLRGGSA